MSQIFRIHPAIGVARVGNSAEFNLAPETLTGFPVPGNDRIIGGLPLTLDPPDEAITSSDLRDGSGALKRQAARFRIFGYPEEKKESWPSGAGTEITIGSVVGGQTVADIVWTVHVANKKANTFVLVEDEDQPQGISSFSDGRLPPIRNADFPVAGATQPADKIAVLNDKARVRALTIDPGPRTVSGADAVAVRFDAATEARYFDSATQKITPVPEYPKCFPSDTFTGMQLPGGAVETLGDIRTDSAGRLIFAGGYGRAAGWSVGGDPAPLDDEVNNDQWFDDTADGPVQATLVFTDGSIASAHSAWVTATDPGFAPQILNIVSLWDDMYDVWVRKLDLVPELYRADGYQSDFRPTFDDQIRPIFRAAALQQWTTNMNPHAQSAHTELDLITAETDPWSTTVAGLVAIFRDPVKDQYGNTTLMPLALGDANQSMLALRETQYFFLKRWNAGKGNYLPGSGATFGPGEFLDKAALMNCLGGRFSPGIDLTFVVREPDLYVQDWRTSGGGPFRIHRKELDYAGVSPASPALTAGYIPRHVWEAGLEPGDLSKFMALPWHTDYNSCATHLPSPNPTSNRTLFWSWPAQRPVAVFLADDVRDGDTSNVTTAELGDQRWSVRGPGTDSPAPENWGRFQPPISQILDNWHRIGVVLQAPTINGAHPGASQNWFLEVGSQLTDTGVTPVESFPNYAATPIDERKLFHQLMNLADNPGVLAEARAYVDFWLAWSERFSNENTSPTDQMFFRYSQQAAKERLNFIYQELVDQANASSPSQDPNFTTRADMITRITQLAPFNLTDGCWLRNIGETGPMDEVRSLLYSILMDELGDGDISRNHCNIYLDLCHSVGYYPPALNSPEFAFDPNLLQSAFTVPAFELAISQFSQEYYPELLGMTVQLEWEVLDAKPTRDLMDYFGINSHFYVMHIGIDNAVNGHGARAVDAIDEYLEGIRSTGGEHAVQAAWRRIWNGFVAFGNIGTFGPDLVELIHNVPTLREQVIAMIKDKSEFGSVNHQDHTIGDTTINGWFADPEGFLDALIAHNLITPGDWVNSRLNALMNFETGPMYRVFTDEEIQLWATYTQSLTQPKPLQPLPPIPPARAMADLIDELRPIQDGNPGHQENLMADSLGQAHTMAWWFTQPTHAIMAALSLPGNELIVRGSPAGSWFIDGLIAPTGPMGPVFDLPSTTSVGKTRREVVVAWIIAGCPLLAELHTTLRLNSPWAHRERHRTGKLYGMATVH